MKLKYEVPVAEFISFGDEIIRTSSCEYHTGWYDVVLHVFDVCNTVFDSRTDDEVL